jgi:hypothetical protein
MSLVSWTVLIVVVLWGVLYHLQECGVTSCYFVQALRVVIQTTCAHAEGPVSLYNFGACQLSIAAMQLHTLAHTCVFALRVGMNTA